MAIRGETERRRDTLEEQAERMGRNLAREAFGKDGPGDEVCLADLERFFDTFVKGFSKGMYAETVQSQADHFPETERCPDCGCECSREVLKEPRQIHTVHGPFSWSEPHYFCSKCERLFFSAAADSAD